MLGLRHILWASIVIAGGVAGATSGCGSSSSGNGAGGAGAGTTTSTTTTATGGTGGSTGTGGALNPTGTNVSSSLALTTDDATLWVVNQDSDSVSVIDTQKGMLIEEILLGTSPPAVDPTTMRYDPAVLPRSLAIVGDERVYVAGESANTVYVLNATTHAIIKQIPVPAAPVAVAAAPDGSAVYVVSHEAAVLSKIDPETNTVTGSVQLTQHPWAVAVSADSTKVFVTHLLVDPGVSVVDAATLAVTKTLIENQPAGATYEIPNGQPRSLYAIAPNPVGGELWVLHNLLATNTPECPINQTCPDQLAFNTTVFPTITTLTPDGTATARRLLFQPNQPGAVGNFTDSCAGPHAVAFTPDGTIALVAHAQSEDVMAFDTATGDEVGLVQPLLSAALLEGIVINHAGTSAYVDGRNTHNVTVISIDETNTLIPVAASSVGPIERLASGDPMPATMRHGQRLFYSANSAAFPLTQNFWMACANCHPEGGSDAVVWLFAQGPRETPSNAGGPINFGWLLRQAMRTEVQQYDATINTEMGGTYHYDNDMGPQSPDLDALAEYVNYGIPFPQNPNLAPGGLTASQTRGQTSFNELCSTCHSGAYLTDSPAPPATPVLHDIGTCVTSAAPFLGQYTDQAAYSYALDPYYTPTTAAPDRAACMFKTPTLRGIFATPPYFHDGSAATLADAVARIPFAANLTAAQQSDLVSYLLTL